MQKNSDSVSFESLLSSSTHSSDSFSEKERQKRVYIKFSPDHLIRLNELYEKVHLIIFAFFIINLS